MNTLNLYMIEQQTDELSQMREGQNFTVVNKGKSGVHYHKN
jgi:hypothetical protein